MKEFGLIRPATDSTVYRFTYDVFGKNESISIGEDPIASYTYNSYNGKLKKVDYGNGFSVEYVYNELDFLKEVWYNGTEGGTLAYAYTYTSDGQVYRLDDHLTNRRQR